jgi:pimeloyl-ACP methyl ester carboxylesterase
MPQEKFCRHVRIVTPKRYLLDGLWFGGPRPKTGIIFVHGLGSTVFAHHNFLTSLASKSTAVLFFNNRGHDKIAGIKRIVKRSPKGYAWEAAGETHERFTDSADDIQGAVNLLKKSGAKKIYLVGHSTGSQKTAYYLAQGKNQKKIAGAAFLSPLSDYASMKKFAVPAKLARAQKFAKALVARKKPHDLLPANIWPDIIDAQRFLSLYTPDSKEEIFSYAEPKKRPWMLQKIRIPLLIVLAGKDEHRDRAVEEIAEWFESSITSETASIVTIPNASHGFQKKEKFITDLIREFTQKIVILSLRRWR